jgi:hypothetical protein
MIATREDLRALLHRFGTETWTLAAIGAAFESGLVDHLNEPCSVEEVFPRCRGLSRGRVERCLGLLREAGLVVATGGRYRLSDGVKPFLVQPARAALAGEIRTNLMQPLAFLDSVKQRDVAEGWRHIDRELLEAQGAASGGFPPMFKASLVPELGDLGARLDRSGARFLDVGVGVAHLAMSMCRLWPELHVVGLDPFDAPLAVARENVKKANLEGRIELRRAGVEDLRDEEAFDLAWFPTPFIPQALFTDAIKRVRTSLRQGGWVLFPVLPVHDGMAGAVWGLMNELWGGPVVSVPDGEGMLRSAGFSAVRTVPGPVWAPTVIVGQR